jgi:ADP-ribose pyrophosphatase
VHEDQTVTLIRQLRPAADGFLLELPAGRLAPGEDPRLAAARELVEETGLAAGALVPLGILHSSPGVFDEVIHLFLATGLTQGDATPEAYEDISCQRIPFAEALAMAADGRITDGKTIAALLRAQRHLS